MGGLSLEIGFQLTALVGGRPGCRRLSRIPTLRRHVAGELSFLVLSLQFFEAANRIPHLFGLCRASLSESGTIPLDVHLRTAGWLADRRSRQQSICGWGKVECEA